MESRPRSVLAAFQEHLQLASTKCGSLMEQLNIVRKKVEGNEALMSISDPVSDEYLENVSQKIVLQSEEMDNLDHKDVLDKEQMAVGNAYVERSTGDTNCDVNKHLMNRTSSQHSEIIINKEEAPSLIYNDTVNESERYSSKYNGLNSPTSSKEKLIKENEKISGKANLNVIVDKEKESFNQDLSDDESTLSSCSSSNEFQEPSDKQNIYEELLRRLKVNEEKKNIHKNRSSSENSSSTFKKSQKTNKSPKKNSSNSTVYEDILDKKNGDIENLNVGVDFFLPSTVTEKFQEMFFEDSGEEEQNNINKKKNMRIAFDDLIIGRPNKRSFSRESHPDKKISSQDRLLNETKLKTVVNPVQLKKQANQQLSHHKQNGKVKEKIHDNLSVYTKSEKNKKTNTATSAVMNYKFHSPELNLYKRLNGAPLKHEMKKNGVRRDIKSKKATISNSKGKTKHLATDPKLKTVPDKKNVSSDSMKNSKNVVSSDSLKNSKNVVSSDSLKNSKNVTKPSIIISKTEKDDDKDIITNKNQPTNNFVTDGKNLSKNSGNETLTTDSQIKKIDEVKSINDTSEKRGRLDEIMIYKEEVKHDKINSDTKKMVSKKNHVIKADNQSISKEKLPQAGKNAMLKEKKPTIPRSEHSKNIMRTSTSGKELSHKLNSVHDEVPPGNMKSKNNKERIRPNTTIQVMQPKKEVNKLKSSSDRKEESMDIRNIQTFDKTSKTKMLSVNVKGKHNNLPKESIHSQSFNEMKTHTASFPFILGQSTSKTYNVRAAIQQTMSMIMRSPAETLRRSSFSEMLNVSSKASTQKTSASYSPGRKVCPACVMRVDEEDYIVDDNPIDPWDTEYHSKRFIRCTCMPRNTVNFKTVMNQLLQETSSSYILPTESYQESEMENGEDNRVNKALFRKNNNIYKLSKLLHTLLKIRDLLVT